jgi:hypothetical protein
MAELHLLSHICLHSIVLNNIFKCKGQFYITGNAFHNLVTRLSNAWNSILKEHCLLRNDAMSVEVYWRFEGTYCFHLQSRKSKASKLCSCCLLLADCLCTILFDAEDERGAECSSETSLNIYQTTWHHIPDANALYIEAVRTSNLVIYPKLWCNLENEGWRKYVKQYTRNYNNRTIRNVLT